MITLFAQFLCVMNGGKLIQDLDNHAIWYTHEITNGKVSYDITSTHHQAQYPFLLNPNDFTLLFWSPRRSHYYDGDGIGNVPEEVEICLYHKPGLPKCLAIQGHPEIMDPEDPVVKMINATIKDILK